MGFFAMKQKVNLEEFCRDFYEKNILNPVIQSFDAGEVYFDTVRKSIVEADQNFSKITSQKLASEMIPLRFELFALAWMHKFVGKFAIAQSVFTKSYLHKKERDDIWNGMEHYNKFIDGATLNWLTSLGKMNLSFWYHMREDMTAKNIEDAKKIGLSDKDESIVRVNNRLCSENAWKQKIVLGGLVIALCERLNLDPKELNEEAGFRLAVAIRGFYDGAYQAIENIKIKI